MAALLGLFRYLQRLPRGQVWFDWGRWHHYILAVLDPVIVGAAITLVSSGDRRN